MNDDEAVWRRLALHESGHAVAAVLVGGEVRDITLYPDRGYGATISRTGDDWLDAVVAGGGWAVTPFYGADHDVVLAAQLVGRDRVDDAFQEARRLLAGQDETLRAVAAALLANGGKLDGVRVAEIVRLPALLAAR